MRYRTREQVITFLRHVGRSRLYALYRLAIMAGLRQGELLGLRWQDVDLEEARLSIRHTLLRDDRGAISFGRPKGPSPSARRMCWR